MPAIGAAISVIAGAIGGAVSAIGATAVGSFFLRLGATVALSALARALAPKPRDPGIQTQSTQTGGVNPLSFVLGTYATAGTLVAPPLTHGPGLAYLAYVIALGAVPGQTLGRVAVNDEWVDLDAANAHADYGLPPMAGSKYAGKLWVRFYDGSQSAVDPMLLAKYDNHPDYPWSTSMVGEGLAYAICTFAYNHTLYSGLPKVLFELGGIPLYDIRKDDMVGGTGTHRWTDRSTWELSDNPVVMIYNILRGIPVGADTWGGGVAGADLPFDAWSAAMMQAEASVSLLNGSTEPAWRAGFEVCVDEPPLDVIDELLKACSGDLTNTGGAWKVRIGAAALPVLTISDDDIIITEEQQLNPFPGLDATFNGVTARYPEPVSLYQSREAPPRYNDLWESDDGNRRLVAGPKVTTTAYLYTASFVVALCEGPITGIGRIWADGKPLDLNGVTWRIYKGDEAQTPDPSIEARMGSGNTPAYRGTAYVMFEELSLEQFGNRIPQLSFEVFRPIAEPDTAEGMVRAVTLIPGTGEFVYATEGISRGTGGNTASENVHTTNAAPDIIAALDQLQAAAPNIENISLVVSWFGTDLRAGNCQILPGVENTAKVTTPKGWSVNGVARAGAHVISLDANGRSAYGGTPTDFAVVQAIQEIKARGLRVTFYPFLLMDIPAGNTLPNPTRRAQPSFPPVCGRHGAPRRPVGSC